MPPLLILEVINRRDLEEGFPVFLFAVLWLLPVAFILALRPLVRRLKAGDLLRARPLGLLLRLAFLLLVALIWIGIVQDQMPCFLGVPNCD